MNRSSDFPVNHPVLTGLLSERIMEADDSRGKAFQTTFRYSDAGKCLRAMAYDSLGTQASDPPDAASRWVMYLGQLIHEEIQGAILEHFGAGAVTEHPSRHGALVSGHSDALVFEHPELGKVCYELKSTGSFAFNKAIGLDRMKYQRTIPEGPRTSAKIQGALNAVAVDADTLVIGVVSMEAVSIQLADKVQFGVLDRIMAEWHYGKAEFAPWATAELARMAAAQEFLDEGTMPPRMAVGDEFEDVQLDPTAKKVPWNCSYCSHKTTCRLDIGARFTTGDAMGAAPKAGGQ